MLNNEIKTIPHHKHRYPTVGDYYEVNINGKTQRRFRISDMKNEDYEFLVSIHEQIEEHLTRKRGIKEEDITAFDLGFESVRPPNNNDEPGDDIYAPYHREHVFATFIEKMIALELGVNWSDYGQAIINLDDSNTGC